jgi:microcystin-dependent protein
MPITMIKSVKKTQKTAVVLMALAATSVMMIAANRAPAEKSLGAEPFIGEISMFAGNFAPRGWAFCDGQLLQISENSALFSLLGTYYGGDGRTTFGLPDLRGRVAIHAGQGPGLTNRAQGSKGGTESVTLTVANLPSHNHMINFVNAPATEVSPDGLVPAIPAGAAGDGLMLFGKMGEAPTGTLNSGTVEHTGGGQSHENMPPFGTVRYIIALQGIFPSRS